jgi:hypothetical protein
VSVAVRYHRTDAVTPPPWRSGGAGAAAIDHVRHPLNMIDGAGDEVCIEKSEICDRIRYLVRGYRTMIVTQEYN